MKRYPVIGIAGRARVGKDTVAETLLRIGAARYRYGFADPIRKMLKVGFGVCMDDPAWQAVKEQPIEWLGRSPRELMQTLGTEWGREMVHRDVWLRLADRALLGAGDGMVISDVRFENEATWVREAAGLVIHVVRPSAEAVAPHASEAGILFHPDVDVLIFNTGSIDELRHHVAELFRQPEPA